MENTADDQALRAAMIGEIILASRQIESRLHAICDPCEAAGLHALTELLSNRLPESLQRELHYIATIRNNAAHDADFNITAEDAARYKHAVEHAMKTLDTLFPAQDSQTANAVSAPAPEATDTADAESDPEKNLAVEQELFAEITRKLAILGYFPVAGLLFLLYVLSYAVFLQGYLVLLTALYGCAVILGIKGYMSPADRGLLYVAGSAVLFAYIATAVLSFCAPVKKLPKIIGILPGVNILYLVIRFLRDLQWGRFLVSAVGLGLLAAAVILVAKGLYNYAAAALLLNWFSGIGSLFLRGNKSEK